MNSKDFVSQIAEHLTGEKAIVEAQEDEYGAVMTISPKGNVSSLIGHAGCTMDAIRVICKAIGYNGKHRIKIRLNEDGNRHTNRN